MAEVILLRGVNRTESASQDKKRFGRTSLARASGRSAFSFLAAGPLGRPVRQGSYQMLLVQCLEF